MGENENTRLVVEVLQKELEQVRAKASATDAAFMSFLSIGVTPFLVFTAYAVAERRYQIFLAALPVLTVLGLSVVVILWTHYSYAMAYCGYLEARINYLLRSGELLDTQFVDLAYRRRSSPVITSYVVALFTLLILNLFAIPAINKFRSRFQSERPKAPVILRQAVCCYWLGVGPFVGVAGFFLVRSALRTARNLEQHGATSIARMQSTKDSQEQRE